MTGVPARRWKQKEKRQWAWPLDVAQYDQGPTLREEERNAIRVLLKGPRGKQFAREPWRTKLYRLLEPILDALKITRALEPVRGTVARLLLREMVRNDSSFWKWKEGHWDEVLRASMASFCRIHGVREDTRPHLIALGILLRRIHDPRRFGEFDRIGLAKKVFGEAAVELADNRVAETLTKWGFSATLNDTRQRTALCDALLVNGSPLLEDLTTEVLEEVYNGHTTEERRRSLQRLSKALHALGLIQNPLQHGYLEARGGKRSDLTVGISNQWIQAAKRWRNTSTLSSRTRAEVYYGLLKMGRWVSTAYPGEASPELWTRETAARCVAEICRMSVGQWTNQVHTQTDPKRPLTPRAINGQLQAIRFFFRDCQEWEWIPRKFDPNRCLRTPSSVKRLIGPNPRIVADDSWAKLVWAGLNLNESDLPCTGHGRFLYPF